MVTNVVATDAALAGVAARPTKAQTNESRVAQRETATDEVLRDNPDTPSARDLKGSSMEDPFLPAAKIRHANARPGQPDETARGPSTIKGLACTVIEGI